MTAASDSWPGSCILLGTLNSDCAKFNFPDPTDPWNSPFYAMRGLYVTVDDPGGPQRITATDGDTVYLQARVYNYSMIDMNVVPDSDCSHASRYPNAVVKVRFYRQPWNTSVNKPLANTDSVLIAETTVPPILGFESSDTIPNWTMASATLDTTGLGGTNQVFWVVAWTEDGEGHMLSELPGHGLSADPAGMTIHTMTDVPLETVDATVDYTGQIPSFSNNVAMLKQVFYVRPTATTASTTSADSTGPNGLRPRGGKVRVENVRLSPLLPRAGERAVLSADLRSVGGPSDGVMVSFFADDPQLQRAFDLEAIPHIDADETYRVEVPFWPGEVRRHAFHVVANLGRSEEAHGGSTKIYLPTVLDRHRRLIP